MNIKTLAKLCGVSVSTVSRAINGHPDVNEEVRQRILQTARDFHYIPNDAARDLVSRRSDAVGLVVKGIGNLFYTPVIRAIENATEDEGFTFVLHQINTDEDELQAGETLARSKNLRGLIFLGGRCDYTSAQTALLTVPFVCCTYRNSFGTLAEDAYSSVTVDDEREAETAVSYLIENGHRDVAILLSCAKDGSVGELRYAGYKNALAKAGIPADPALTAESGGYSLHGAYRAAAGLAASGARFTALFAAADTMALAAVRALFDAGLRVPEDVSVISIDGISVSQYTVPALTTLVQPAEELGRTAVSMLVAIIRGEAINRHVTLAAALRKGESVKKVSG